MLKNLELRRNIAIGILIAFLGQGLSIPQVQAQDFSLPTPGVMVYLSPAFNPPILKGIKVHPDNPFRFDFILDKGDSQLSNDTLKDESNKLIKYFLASLTIPEKDLWVNLSPYEKNRIVPESFGRTEMGRDLLAEDYMLKQITASLIYPEGKVGHEFWNRVYAIAEKGYGTSNIQVNTFNKVWIVPDKAVVYENAKTGTAYVAQAKLKVMLEQDYLSLKEHEGISGQVASQGNQTNQIGSQVVREIVLPELEREVNQDKNFACLRQVYNSLILAAWYKKKIKDSILAQVYADRNKVAGVNYNYSVIPMKKGIHFKNDIEGIYRQYLQAFKKGVYNYIKEDFDTVTQQEIPRKYFSGGLDFAQFTQGNFNIHPAFQISHDSAMLSQIGKTDNAVIVTEDTVPEGNNPSHFLGHENLTTNLRDPVLIRSFETAVAEGVAQGSPRRSGSLKITNKELLKLSDLKKRDPPVQKYIRYFNQTSRFLKLDHPLVRKLQGYLDLMREDGYESPQLLIAVDGVAPIAFSIGDVVVINLALINKLDTIDELLAVLAHEQGHFEFHKEHPPSEIPIGMGQFSAKRLQEYGADNVTGPKLARLGLNTLAIADALRKIAGPESFQDITHGSISNRILATLMTHQIQDFESVKRVHSDLKRDTLIPDHWRAETINPNLEERILKLDFGEEFKDVVRAAPLELLSSALNKLFRKDFMEINKEKILFIIQNVDNKAHELSIQRKIESSRDLIALMAWSQMLNLKTWGVLDEHLKNGRGGQELRLAQQLIHTRIISLLKRHGRLKEEVDVLGKAQIEWVNTSEIKEMAYFVVQNLIENSNISAEILGQLPFEVTSWEYFSACGIFIKSLGDLLGSFWGPDFIKNSIHRLFQNAINHYWENNTRDREHEIELFKMIDTLFRFCQQEFGLTPEFLESRFEYGENPIQKSLEDSKFADRDELAGMVGFNGIEKEIIDILNSGDPNKIRDLLMDPAKLKIFDDQINFGSNSKRVRAFIKDDKNASIIQLLIDIIVNHFPKKEGRYKSDSEPFPPFGMPTMHRGQRNIMHQMETAIDLIQRICSDKNQLRESSLLRLWTSELGREAIAQLPPVYLLTVLKYSTNANSHTFVEKLLASGDFDYARDRLIEKILKHDEADYYYKFLREVLNSSSNYVGATEIASQWLRIIHKAYLTHLQDIFVDAVSVNDPQKSINYYFNMENNLPSSDNRSQVLNAYAHVLIDRLSDNDLRDFMVKLMDTGKLTDDIYNYFVQQRVRTKEQFEFFNKEREKYLSTLAAQGNKTMSLGVLADTAVDYLLKRKKAEALFVTMMNSGENDKELREELFPAWWEGVQKAGEFYGYDIRFRYTPDFTRDQFDTINYYPSRLIEALKQLGIEVPKGDDSIEVLNKILRIELVQYFPNIDFSSYYSFEARRLRESKIPLTENERMQLNRLILEEAFPEFCPKNDQHEGTYELIGPGQGNFMPFDDFVAALYELPNWKKLAIMQRLLLSPDGLLHSEKGREEFVKVVSARLPKGSTLADLIQRTLKATVSTLDAERLFLIFSRTLLSVFLKRPANPEKEIPKFTVFIGKPEALTRFLRKYISRPEFFPTAKGIHQDLEDFYASINSKLGKPVPLETLGSQRPLSDTISPIEIILSTCQNLGPVGVRFLQVLGQYMPIPEEYQERFRDVYDSAPGQDLFVAWNTLLQVAIHDPEVRKFVDEDLVSLDETIGRGSIVTVFLATVRDRDSLGRFTGGTHQEVLKIRAPNAESFVNEIAEKAIQIVTKMQAEDPGNNDKYEVAKRALRDIKEWVLGDITDTSFLEMDAHYHQAHEQFVASNGIAVRIAAALRPNNKDVKREPFVKGVTLNRIVKWLASGKTMEELLEENSLSNQEREFLQYGIANGISLQSTLEHSTSALMEDFSRQLARPTFIRANGQVVYLMHSDLHFGNAIISADRKSVYPIDRNFYLQLNRKDAQFIRTLAEGSESVSGKALLKAAIKYFRSDSRNRSFMGTVFSPAVEAHLLYTIGTQLKGNQTQSPMAKMTALLGAFESRGYSIPLEFRIMLKNLISVNTMLLAANAGILKDYIRSADISSKPLVDNAILNRGTSKANVGGIDLNSININLKSAGTGSIKFHIDSTMLKRFQNAPGFVPVIINIQPMINIRGWLGLNNQKTDNPKMARL